MVHQRLRQVVRRGALMGVLAAPLLAVEAPVADAGETPTCFGEPATIVVSEPGNDVVGTEGADVMVVTDTEFWTVQGLGGDDRICTDGQGMGGRGDDRIYRRGPRDDDPHLSPLMRGGAQEFTC